MAWISWDKMTRPKGLGGLGFKDIPCFNDAMLAKLSWRLLKSPSCLLARTLQGKYCLNDTFLECVAPSNSSHGWRSVLIGRDLLKKNLGWANQVGNGEKIRIWSDFWMTHSSQLRPTGPANEPETEPLVSSLFKPNSLEWDQEKIRDYLPGWESEILGLKPSKNGGEDSLIWLLSMNGDYSTKSGYASVIYNQKQTGDDNYRTNSNSYGWNSLIWAKKMPSKIKILLWKAWHNALLVGERLLARSIVQNPPCKLCGFSETIGHVFFEFYYARKVWELAPISNFAQPTSTDTFIDWWKKLSGLLCLPPSGITGTCLASWIVWYLWIARNSRTFTEKFFSESETVEKAIINAREWQEAQPLHTIIPPRRSEMRCIAAATASHCKVDASWCAQTKIAGLAAIVRSPNQAPVEFSKVEQWVNSPLMAESLAIRHAVDQASSLGISNLIIETDSQVLAKAWASKKQIAEIYGILEDIKILSLSFSSFSISYIPRSLNGDADALVKHALHSFVLKKKKSV